MACAVQSPRCYRIVMARMLSSVVIIIRIQYTSGGECLTSPLHSQFIHVPPPTTTLKHADIPGNAFSHQQFLDLYGGGGDEHGNALDWNADMLKILNFPPFPPHQLHLPAAHLSSAPDMQSASSQVRMCFQHVC